MTSNWPQIGSKPGGWLLIPLGPVALLIGLYAGTYILAGDVEKTEESTGILADGSCIFYPAQTARTFGNRWLAAVFPPAAFLEAKVTKREIVLCHGSTHVYVAEP